MHSIAGVITLPADDLPPILDEETLLTRPQTSRALKRAGYPVEKATLATLASRGGGPEYQRFGRRVIYRWGPTLAWAKSRLSSPIRSTSELDVTE
jgi:hypothetical protein